MRKFLVTICILLVCALVGCSQGYHWSKKHPFYAQAPYGELAVAGTQSAFVLTRTAWFANRLGISNDSIQIQMTALCANFMLDELRGGYKKLVEIPDSVISKYPEESQKIDERIFMKGRLPEQGISLKDSEGNIPPVILLIHEVIIGTDLKREDYFDYSLIHNEVQTQKMVENITAVVSYTLWDNVKQRPLFSAIDEVQHPVKTLTMDDMSGLVKEMVKQIRTNLYMGAK